MTYARKSSVSSFSPGWSVRLAVSCSECLRSGANGVNAHDPSSLAPVLVIAVSLGHYTVIRGEVLTPSIAFVRTDDSHTNFPLICLDSNLSLQWCVHCLSVLLII
jgi:hypothetical protein